MSNGAAIGFWRTVWLLLATSRRRSEGRQRRQRELLNNRSGRDAIDWGALGVIIGVIIMAVLHGAAAFAVIAVVDTGQRIEAEHAGRIVVSDLFLAEVQLSELGREAMPGGGEAREVEYAVEALEIVERDGGDAAEVERRLREAVAASGSQGLVGRDEAETGVAGLARAGPTGAVLGSVMLLWWFAMVVCQGEGLELDLQRRRHPMWEWLLSHPIGAGAAFFAEMLSPLFVNPTYWSAPLFVGILFGAAQGQVAGFAAAVLVGVPLTVAAACLGKALEIGAILRLPVRSRGAVIGLLGWFGYASMVAMFFGTTVMPQIALALDPWTRGGPAPVWSPLGLFLGLGGDGTFSFARGALFGWTASALAVAAGVVFSAGSVRNGLSGAFAADSLPARRRRSARFGRDPLFRKEYLWFVRDRSAVVQTILIPVTIAAFQLFNLRDVVRHAQDSWNYLAGAAVFFGTYFLWVLGPKSLTSEGSALWIALTWPRGLESVLKAKAWLWSTIASGLVVLILAWACWVFPHEWWKIALVGAGWFVFSRSMAEKSVTLVTVVSESGEAQKIPSGRRWAAQLGMLSFAIGVCMEQWSLAIVGIVYSWVTAAAMWQNLRARLPYLYDPWSETLPRPPTLMHAMVAITILIECAAIITGLILAVGGEGSLGIALGIGYALCAVGVSIAVSHFLSERGVSPARLWCWRETEPEPDEDEEVGPGPWIRRYLARDRREAGWLLVGLGGGVVLALFAQLCLSAIALIPSIAETIRASELQMQSMPNMATAYAVIAIAFAPFAEEYLFRGLVFRTLDREWGGWTAVLASAAFFAIYHPPLAWLPVFAVGAANCLLFKRSQRLAPAVLLHMSYNAVVTLWI